MLKKGSFEKFPKNLEKIMGEKSQLGPKWKEEEKYQPPVRHFPQGVFGTVCIVIEFYKII